MNKNPPKHLGEIIGNLNGRSSLATAIKLKRNHSWVSLSWQSYYQDIKSLSLYLRSLGLSPGDRVGILANTRYEWSVSDLAAIAAQGVVIPIYPNNNREDVLYILNHSQAEILILETSSHYQMIRDLRSQLPHLKTVLVINEVSEIDKGDHSWKEAMGSGHGLAQRSQAEFSDYCKKAQATELVSVVYTSGTTGRPKGAMISHEQVISEVSQAFPLCGLTEKDTTLAFLPFAHVLGRIEHWGHLYIGNTMAYAESLERMRNNLNEINPDVLIAVPRIFEKIHTAILNQAEMNLWSEKLFHWALDIGEKVSHLKQTGQMIPLSLLLQYEAARKAVLEKIKGAFGNRLRFAISGGAPLNSEVARFFHAAGVLVLEGYGLTETTGAVCVNTPFNFRIGTVGKPIGDVKIKIADDGEILIQSKKVMTGYYKEDNSMTFVDSWFPTGDIGELLAGGHLRITDRKKDLIKTAGGKYVVPQKLENLIMANPLISHSLIHGDSRKYVVALLTLDRQMLESMAKKNGWSYEKWTDLTKHPQVIDNIKKFITKVNSQLASYESIKNFKIIPKEFTIEGGELTPSLKIKRKHLDKVYKEVLDSLY